MSLYSHKIFKLALLKDAVYAADDFMHCLDVPQAPSMALQCHFDGMNLTDSTTSQLLIPNLACTTPAHTASTA